MIRFCAEEAFDTYIETILEAYRDRDADAADLNRPCAEVFDDRREGMAKTALVVGAGDGISASFARALAREGITVGLAARRTDKLAALRGEIGGPVFACDAADAGEVARLFDEVDDRLGAIDIVHYNPSYRVRGPLVDLDPAEVQKTLMVSAFGGFLVGQQAARRMLRQGSGAILFTGASASVKGYANSASFAMGKFALRGLAQSMARELAPKNIHVAHFVIDGGVRAGRRPEPASADSMLDPGRDRRELSLRAQAAPQRLDLGGRAPTLGRDFCPSPGTFHGAGMFFLLVNRQLRRAHRMLGTILLIILILLLLGALPTWPHSRGWGYYPSGGLGLVLIIVLILLLMGRI